MSVNKAVREVLKSTLLLKQKKLMAMSPWANRNVVLITENDLLTQEKSMLQIVNPRRNKVASIDVSNIVYVHPNVEDRTITIVLPDDSEIVFKAVSHQLLVLWIAALKVAMSKGTLFHVRYRSRDGMVEEDALLQFADILTQGSKNQDQILLLSSPLDDITRHAWRVSEIRQFRITDLGISIEFCHNCYRTHIARYKSFNLFVHTPVMNACIEFICKNTQAVACSEMLNSFITIYRIRNHQCPIFNPPSTPPPPVPPANIDNRPPIPCRDYPRFGYLSAPCAKPRLRYPDLVSPYKITNKIVINDDGSISHESTILGHRANSSNPNPLKPPRKQKIVQQPKTDKAEDFQQQKVMHRKLHRNTSGKLLPPKDIKRTNVPMKNISKPAPTHLKLDMDGDDDDKDEVYQESWIADEGYVHMYPGLFQPPLSPVVDNLKASHDNPKVQIVNQVSVPRSNSTHSPSVDSSDDELDFIDREYINIQNILIELDVKNIPKSQGNTKPPIKKRTFKLIRTEVETRHTNRPPIKPRKTSINLPVSPKPIPRRRTTSSHTSPIQNKFDILEPVKQEDLNENKNNETTCQLDTETKSTASPELPNRNVSVMENRFSEDNDDVFTENATTPRSHFPLGYATSAPGNLLQPLSGGNDQPSFQEQASVVLTTASSSNDQQAGTSSQPNDRMITRHASVEESVPENDSLSANCAVLSNKIV